MRIRTGLLALALVGAFALPTAAVHARPLKAHKLSGANKLPNANKVSNTNKSLIAGTSSQAKFVEGRTASAHPKSQAAPHFDTIDAIIEPARSAPVGGITRVPYGWADFCARRPSECRVDVLDPVDIKMNPRVMRKLEAVNSKVNAEIEPVSNFDHWGTMLDHWDYPTDGKGDCKIYALWKRKQLLDMGFPRQALLMTIVRDLDGNGHTILTVKTDRGDYVLDNMVGEIRLWDQTGYKFVKRQSQADPNVWVSIGPATMPVTTAVLN